ncbi:PqiC family protein [Marinomonas sp.]|nr:ABC-type transport auxiliary lipoprotein family protein [Marinomonas sp.]MDB4838036.1 PqiC family protein [Marinomonas sp.]
MKKCKVVLCLLLIWLTTACATKVAPSSEYLLIDQHAQHVTAMTTSSLAIQFMPVSMANYLSGNEIVLVTKQGQVHRSKNHLWAETLSPQLSRLTLQRLEKSLPNITWFGGQRLPPESIAVLNIEVDDFYADLKGVVHISGRWQLLSALGEVLSVKTFYATEDLKADGYLNMVKTLSDIWFQKVVSSISENISMSMYK